MTSEFSVADATCGHCKSTIETTVLAVTGVTAVELDLGSKRLKVEHDPSVGSPAVAEAISMAGYTPEVVA